MSVIGGHAPSWQDNPAHRNGLGHLERIPRTQIAYRPEIDGLRGWAVGLVVLYHAKFEIFSGGFVGVDIFFVISGYLITLIIATDVETGEFSLIRFYERRARRILPALFAVVISTMIVSSIVMLPRALESVAESGLASALFFSNLYFWRYTGNYFAPAAEMNPLLHTWSLAVEEQFYIVFPFAAALLLPQRRVFLALLCTGVAASLALAQTMNTVAPSATFYLPPARAWEFGVGALLALRLVPRLRSARLNTLLVAFGLAMIILSALVLSRFDPFPGILAVPPVLGAALVIHCGNDMHATLSSLLTGRPVVLLGLISYSLYLWHWPVLVLAEHYVLLRPYTLAETLLALTLVGGLSVLTYRLVEQPFRRLPLFQRRPALFASTSALAAALVALCAVLITTEGLRFRYPLLAQVSLRPQLNAERAIIASRERSCFVREVEGYRGVEGCVLMAPARPDAPNIMLWGDSFALHYFPAMTGRALPGGRGLLGFAAHQCPPVLSYDPVNVPACAAVNEAALQLLNERSIDTVILSARWLSYTSINRISLDDVADTVRALQNRGITVIIIGQSPEFIYQYPDEAYYLQLQNRVAAPGVGRTTVPLDYNETLQASVRPDMFFDPMPLFCDGERCRYRGEDGFYVADFGHLMLVSSTKVVDALWEAMVPLLPRANNESGTVAKD